MKRETEREIRAEARITACEVGCKKSEVAIEFLNFLTFLHFSCGYVYLRFIDHECELQYDFSLRFSYEQLTKRILKVMIENALPSISYHHVVSFFSFGYISSNFSFRCKLAFEHFRFLQIREKSLRLS